MEKMFSQEQLVTIKNLHQSQFKWTTDGYEMQLEGALFDVKELTINNDGTITVTGLFDEKEDSILDRLQSKENEEDDAAMQNILSQFFNNVLALTKPNWLLEIPVLSLNNKLHVLIPTRLCCLSFEIINPPPKV
ncbi:MAG TPA: hypothetical protein PLA68_02985 [Panacibacter sp.]|nr:hypothetical protein [Panacibacter sp.]